MKSFIDSQLQGEKKKNSIFCPLKLMSFMSEGQGLYG
jgi:hypothetical protein